MTLASDRASAIFFALSRVPVEEHARLLDERCGDDVLLRAEVERLLRSLTTASSITPVDRAAAARVEGASFPPGTVVGDFIVVRQIGAGGAGVVHLAHQQHPPRVVALKVLRREFVASVVQRRFEVEAELLAQLQHPGIAQIYAAHPGDETTPPFIAMELVNGPPITEYAEAHGLPDRRRIELLASVCDAVQHAHQRGVIHRDLKPGNILVGEDGQPKVLDFGVARRIDMTGITLATETGQLVGTLAYMSPEQVQSVPGTVDTRTDIHALGVILFRLLAGHLPFGRGDPSLPELARRIVQDEATRLGTIRPELKGDIEIIVARALAKEKERRYPSAAGLAADLRRYLAGQPISASADSAWYVVRRQVLRYRLALAACVATIAVVTALAAYANLQRTRGNWVNAQLERQLSANTVERGRLVSITGNHPVAEDLVWRELFRHPESRHTRWTLWDIYSREPSLWTKIEHETGTQTIRFSPDNRLLLTAGRLDGELHLLDAERGDLIRTFVTEPRSGTLRMAFTPDGATIVAGTADGSVHVWDAASGALRRSLKGAVPGLRDIGLSSNGRHAVALGTDGLSVVGLADADRNVRSAYRLSSASALATHVASAFAVIGASDGTVTAVDVSRGARLWQIHGHDTEVISLAVSPDGRSVVSGGIDGSIGFWSAETGARVRALPWETGRVRNFSFDAAGATLAIAGQWRTRIWSLTDLSAMPRDFGGSEGMTDIHVRPDGRRLATSNGGSGQLRIWDLVADSRVDHWSNSRIPVTGLAVDKATDTILTVDANGGMSRRRKGQRDPLTSFASEHPINAFDLSADGRWLVTVGRPGTAAVWDAHAGRRVAELSESGSSRAVTFVPGARQIVIGESTGMVRVWDWSEGTVPKVRSTTTEPGEVVGVLASRERIVVSRATTREVQVVDASSGREIRRFQLSSAAFSLALTPDGRSLVAGTYLGVVEVWNPETGRKLRELKGQTGTVTGVDVSSEGELVVTCSRDGTTRLWDGAGQFLATVASRGLGARRVRFLPDGRHVAIAYDDGVVEIRDLDYFFRYAAGQADYQMRVLTRLGESFPHAADVLSWSRGILARP